ncbi:MAG: YwaF family protein [Lachnospiraceae bacterium]|nr:YwaF family protein [Lachnospiraceae bacterium]
MGYPLFGATHLISVAVTLALVLFALAVFKKKSGDTRKKLRRPVPLIMLIMEIFKDLFLLSVGRFGTGYLPLHVCGIGIFVFCFREYLPWRPVKDFFGEVAFVLIMPASVAALFFADWTVYYPVLNFMNLYSYIWHGLLILYPAALLIEEEISPSVRHMYRVILFLCAVVPPVYLFDKRFGCNYFFVNRPVPGSPLSFFASFMGNPGYLFGYAVSAVIVMLFVYFCVWGRKRILARNQHHSAL